MAITQQAFSLRKAAKLLGCHHETLRRAIKRSDLEAWKIGRDYKILKIELEEYWLSRAGGKFFFED